MRTVLISSAVLGCVLCFGPPAKSQPLVSGAAAASDSSRPRTSIGAATAQGIFLVGGTEQKDIAEVYEGTVIRTRTSPSWIRLDNGARVTLAGYSSATVMSDRLILTNGSGDLVQPAGRSYNVEALALRIAASEAGSIAHISIANAHLVRVSGENGTVQVTTATGKLVARIPDGGTLEFAPPAGGASRSLSMSGAVAKSGEMYLLTDDLTHVTAELRGSELNKLVGKKVQVTGTLLEGAAPAGVASHVMRITSVHTTGNSEAKAAGSASGMSVAGEVAIIAGVGAAAAGVGFATANAASDNKAVYYATANCSCTCSPNQSVSPKARCPTPLTESGIHSGLSHDATAAEDQALQRCYAIVVLGCVPTPECVVTERHGSAIPTRVN